MHVRAPAQQGQLARGSFLSRLLRLAPLLALLAVLVGLVAIADDGLVIVVIVEVFGQTSILVVIIFRLDRLGLRARFRQLVGLDDDQFVIVFLERGI